MDWDPVERQEEKEKYRSTPKTKSKQDKFSQRFANSPNHNEWFAKSNGWSNKVWSEKYIIEQSTGKDIIIGLSGKYFGTKCIFGSLNRNGISAVKY